MADKFDEFSKHLAKRQTRRGVLKFLGAGVVGAFVSAVFSREAVADHDKFKRPFFNQILPIFNNLLPPQFNHTLPKFNETLPPVFNGTLPPKFNNTLPKFNGTNPTFPIFRRRGR